MMRVTHHGAMGTSYGFPHVKTRSVRYKTRYRADLAALNEGKWRIFRNLIRNLTQQEVRECLPSISQDFEGSHYELGKGCQF